MEEISKFSSLTKFSMQSNALETVPSGIEWSDKLEDLNFAGNNIELIEPYAFSSASNVSKINLSGPRPVHVSTNGFHITSRNVNKEILISGPPGTYDANAFGNVDGGELWDSIYFNTYEFPENVFRLMIKAHLDKAHSGK